MKYLIVALFLAFFLSTGLLGKVVCNKYELEDINAALNKELMQSNLELGRAHTQFDDANKYVEELEGEIQQEITKREALVTRYGKLRAKLRASRSNKKVETIIKYLPGEPFFVPANIELEPGRIYFALEKNKLHGLNAVSGVHEDHRIKIFCGVLGVVMPDGSIPMSINYNLDLTIKGVLAETITPSGAINHYITLTEIDNEGREVEELKLTQFDMVVDDQRAPRWYWWAPHLDIGAFGGYHTHLKPGFGGSLGFSVMGYGLTPNDLSWRVLRVSADVSDTFGIGLTPGMYNIGGPIPLVSNIWLGPHVTFNMDGTQIVSLWMGAVL